MCWSCDPVAFSGDRIREAKKPHQCLDCEVEIPVGTRYVHFFGKIRPISYGGWGEFFSGNLCCQCMADWDELECMPMDTVEEFCVCYGTLRETIACLLNSGDLSEDNPMVQRWFPEESPESSVSINQLVLF